MKRKSLSPVLLTLTLLCGGAAAQAVPAVSKGGPPELYRLDATPLPPAKGELALHEAVEEFAITLDPKLVDRNPETLMVELPGGPRLEAHRLRFVTYEKDWKSWSGELRYPGSAEAVGYALLIYHGDFVTGLLNTDEGRFRLADPLGRSGQRLVRVKDAAMTLCPVDGGSHAPREVPVHTWRPRGRAGAKMTAGIEKTTVRLDVLALYTKDFYAFPLSEVSMMTFVQDSITLGNDIFANTGVDAYYNLLQTLPILDPMQKPSATGLEDALDWMNSQADISGSEFNTLRTAFGADIVTLYVPYLWDDDPACGVANLPNAAGNFNPGPGAFGTKAFSANRYNCGYNDYTLAHEIGHNYGMRHNNTSDLGAKHSFGKGYVFPPLAPTKATVMGCYCTPGIPCTASPSAVCNRVPYFSDPDIFYSGTAIGDASHRNADVAHAEVATYAGFKGQSLNSDPTAVITCPSSPCPGGVCTFSGTSSTDNGSISTYQWDFADGTTKFGSSVTKAFGSGTSQWVHLVVTDNQGQRDLGLTLCTIP